MGARRKTHESCPAKTSILSVPHALKAEVEAKASDLIARVLKPKHVRPPSEDNRFNYIIDIGTKWHGNHFYFVSTYACPWPKALSPTFESKFARIEHVGNAKFALDFMRHTEEWVRLYDALTINQCMKAIRNDPMFVP